MLTGVRRWGRVQRLVWQGWRVRRGLTLGWRRVRGLRWRWDGSYRVWHERLLTWDAVEACWRPWHWVTVGERGYLTDPDPATGKRRFVVTRPAGTRSWFGYGR